MVRRHKENFLLSKQNNSQNFCFQPIIFEHFSVSMGVENILRLKNILKFMASGHACLSVEQKERYISHHAFCRYIFTIQQKVEHTGRQEASQQDIRSRKCSSTS
jgi:hypothetical protein